jgi:hypothetical protein
MTPQNQHTGTDVAPSIFHLRMVLADAEAATAQAAEADAETMKDHPPDQSATTGDDPRSDALERARRASIAAAGVVGGEASRRAITTCVDREFVASAARRVASRQTASLTDRQVLLWLAEKPGRIRMLGGHLHEMLDAQTLKRLAKMSGGRARTLALYAEHNRQGLDGAYKAATRKVTKKAAGSAARKGAAKPLFAQHKLSDKPETIATAANKIGPRLRGKTEVVVPRGAKKAAKEGVQDSMRIRESGHSIKDIDRMLKSAADPARVEEIGIQAGRRLGAKAIAGAGLASGGISVLFDTKGLIEGTTTPVEAAENAAWASLEGATTAAVASAATMAAATAALAGSSLAGTTVMAAGLATLGPVGLAIGCGVAVSFGVGWVRKTTRD